MTNLKYFTVKYIYRCMLSLWSGNVLNTKTEFFKTRCTRKLKVIITLDQFSSSTRVFEINHNPYTSISERQQFKRRGRGSRYHVPVFGSTGGFAERVHVFTGVQKSIDFNRIDVHKHDRCVPRIKKLKKSNST